MTQPRFLMQDNKPSVLYPYDEDLAKDPRFTPYDGAPPVGKKKEKSPFDIVRELRKDLLLEAIAARGDIHWREVEDAVTAFRASESADRRVNDRDVLDRQEKPVQAEVAQEAAKSDFEAFMAEGRDLSTAHWRSLKKWMEEKGQEYSTKEAAIEFLSTFSADFIDLS